MTALSQGAGVGEGFPACIGMTLFADSGTFLLSCGQRQVSLHNRRRMVETEAFPEASRDVIATSQEWSVTCQET